MRGGRFVVLGALLALAILTGTAVAGTDEGSVTIKVTGSDFSGKVKSNVSFCEDGRKVTLMKQRPGKDAKIVSDTTDDAGAWSTGNTGQTKGTFYAKLHAAGDCEKARSKKITL